MAYLATTPQEDIQAGIAEAGENAKNAMMWFLVIAVIVGLILFSGKRR